MRLTPPRALAKVSGAALRMKGRFRQPIWMIPLAIAGLVALIGEFGNARLRHTVETQLRAELSATLRPTSRR